MLPSHPRPSSASFSQNALMRAALPSCSLARRAAPFLTQEPNNANYLSYLFRPHRHVSTINSPCLATAIAGNQQLERGPSRCSQDSASSAAKRPHSCALASEAQQCLTFMHETALRDAENVWSSSQAQRRSCSPPLSGCASKSFDRKSSASQAAYISKSSIPFMHVWCESAPDLMLARTVAGKFRHNHNKQS